MQPDDELCYCFHVPLRKILNFIRVRRPQRVSQLSECGGAGTGCGWCVPYLQKTFQAAQSSDPRAPVPADVTGLSLAEYASGRAEHIAAGKGRPPGSG